MTCRLAGARWRRRSLAPAGALPHGHGEESSPPHHRTAMT